MERRLSEDFQGCSVLGVRFLDVTVKRSAAQRPARIPSQKTRQPAGALITLQTREGVPPKPQETIRAVVQVGSCGHVSCDETAR